MSSDRTKESVCGWQYIYIYITWYRLWPWVSCNQQSLDRVKIFKKKPINMANFLFEKWGLFVCVPKFVCYWTLVCLCMCSCLHIHMYVCVFLLAYIFYIFISAVCWWERVKQRKREEKSRWGRRKWIVENFFFFLTLWLLKVYFDLNMKSLFCGEFCWVMMMIKIKIIIT